ncbi:MAG: DUF937 domain-containing protein [Flavobacteriaceae bacterium]|nr:DUF937 domain-containing protein [Flavobacteriaceae bacterium]
MGIADLLNSPIGKNLIDGTSKQLGLNPEMAASALSSAMPMILGAMKNNAAKPEGAAGLLKAFGSDTHKSGGILDNLSSILGGNNIDSNVLDDGSKILGHLFGGQENNAAEVVGKSSGLDMNSAASLMKIAAPLVMGYLGKNALQKGVSNEQGVMGLLDNFLGNDNKDELLKSVGKIQDFDNNDDTTDDIANVLSGLGGNRGILGGILGNFLK